MDNSSYTSLTRQSGLLREMQVIANNIANAATTGYRQEGLVFAEHIAALEGEAPSLTMATANVRNVSLQQGGLTQTGATFDLAIEGPGFFLIETPGGERLSRAGNFTPSAAGELVTPDGHRLLDGGGAPVFAPADAGPITISGDGTMSANGQPIAQIGLYEPADPTDLVRESGVLFRSDTGVLPVDGSAVLQGFLEDSNVDPIGQIARMIEVQRAYELGQNFLDKEDQRMRSVMQLIAR
jgi:flagellar basal-body rod protein FlgF